MSALATVLSIALVLASCASSTNQTAPEPRPSSTRDGIAYEFGRALIDTDEGSVIVRVEIAENDEQRRHGLMNRRSLPDDSGMFFVYFEETTGGLWMKDTLIPLSVAFIDAEGAIVRILDMEPCLDDPCTVYDPGTAYSAALEVERGSFDRWGVEVGDRVTLTH